MKMGEGEGLRHASLGRGHSVCSRHSAVIMHIILSDGACDLNMKSPERNWVSHLLSLTSGKLEVSLLRG